MKNWKKLLLCCAVGLTTTACTLETSDNGSLDGFWQLTQVDSLHNGMMTDMRTSGIFWAVQAKMLEVRNVYKKHSTNVIFRFQHIGNWLILSEPVVDNREAGDSILTDMRLLRPYGLTGPNDTLTIWRLDGEEMLLDSKIVRMHFRRY